MKIIEDASGKTLMSVIQRKIVSDSIVYTDCWKGYDVLDISDFHHVRINHSELFADGRSHINGIENFWISEPSDICAVSMAYQGRIWACS